MAKPMTHIVTIVLLSILMVPISFQANECFLCPDMDRALTLIRLNERSAT